MEIVFGINYNMTTKEKQRIVMNQQCRLGREFMYQQTNSCIPN